MSEKTLKLIQENDVKWVDVRFTDPRGKEQHTTFPSHVVDAEWFQHGCMFDGSSVSSIPSPRTPRSSSAAT
jgi:glutamine synthetase